MQKNIVWFKRDLRIHDNLVLNEAARSGSVLPVYVLNPADFEEDELGLEITGKFRRRFLWESLLNLRWNLQKAGADLVVLTGEPEEVLPQLAREVGAGAVFSSESTYFREQHTDQKVAERLQAVTIPVYFFHQHTLFHPDDLPFSIDSIPDVYTNFRKKVEKESEVRPLVQVPVLAAVVVNERDLTLNTKWDWLQVDYSPDPRQVITFKGGEDEGLARLDHYFWQGDHLKQYKWTRNGLLGADYSSKLSAWLALGCISPRKIYQEIKQYEHGRTKNISTYWLFFELLWRDYFQFQAMKHGEKLEKISGIREKTTELNQDREVFNSWCQGETGHPFIDANLKEIAATGYMSNRGRQNVASYMVKDLKVDWTWGAKYFRSLLVDYDPASNWGNWAYVAGVGNDPRENRYFNPDKQAEKYDPEGKYVKSWLGQF